ncbi:MAG: hypothetical protein KGH62_05050, partial [Candidatus Micrarchaeota archaeon]|nr:hypothetical protein [Candidatus Micrarchaeota archaeon]
MDEKHMQLLKDWNAKHRVSLEVDSIMADVLTPIIKIFNRRHGTNYTLDGVNGTPRWSTANIHADEFLPNYYIPAWQNHHREIPVLVDRGLLSGAHRHYKIDIVSSRSDAT